MEGKRKNISQSREWPHEPSNFHFHRQVVGSGIDAEKGPEHDRVGEGHPRDLLRTSPRYGS